MKTADPEEAERLRPFQVEDESKRDAVPPTVVQRLAKCLGARAPRVPVLSCYRLGLCLLCLVVLGLAIAVTVLGVQATMGMPIVHVMSMMRSVPTVKDWDAHRACLADAKCDPCTALDPKMRMHPSPRGQNVALLAVRGSGGVLLEQLCQSATRLLTSVNDCWLAHALPLSWSGAMFKSACAGEFFWTHAAFVRFFHWPSPGQHPGYEPTHVIALSRHPFESIFSAWTFHVKCRETTNPWCVSRGVDDADFADAVRWGVFAVERAKEWAALEAAAASTSLPLLRVDYADLVHHRVPTMQRVVEFLGQAGVQPLPTTSQAVACAVADQSTASKRKAGDVSVRQAFADPALVQQVCEVVRRFWNQTRWGKECGPP